MWIHSYLQTYNKQKPWTCATWDVEVRYLLSVSLISDIFKQPFTDFFNPIS